MCGVVSDREVLNLAKPKVRRMGKGVRFRRFSTLPYFVRLASFALALQLLLSSSS
jgi:hypothetical protein